MADLKAERNIELDALRVQRIVSTVVGGQAPEPGHDPKAAEAQLAHTTPELAHGLHRAREIDRCEPERRPGCSRTKPATSSLSIKAPCGPHQARRPGRRRPPPDPSPRCVADSGISGIESCRAQRRREAKNG